MAVYLLHSTVGLPRSGGGIVRHYLGYTCDGRMATRLQEHRTRKNGSHIVRAFLDAGGELYVGNYWPGLTRDDERRMKRNGHLEEKCLVCGLTEAERKLRNLTW